MQETLAPASFFVSGGTVPLQAASYVVREADRELLEALRAGRYAYVLTSRQMGKSSLSVRTMEALRAEGARTAFVDLTRVGGRNVTPDQWYAGLLGEVGRGLGKRADLLGHWKANADVGPMQRFFGALREAVAGSEAGLVVFIDEIDATQSLPFSTDEFFAGIRECFNRRVQDPTMERLAFCLIGVATPSDLMADVKLTPFNIGERIVLRDFTLQEVAPLAAGLGPAGMALVARVHHWTGGQPFLTQSLCRRLVEESSRTPEDVDRLVEAELFEPRARETNINLADVGNRVLNSYDDPEAIPRYRANVLSLYEEVRKGRRVQDDESNRLVAALKLAGIVRAEGGRLRLRNRVYARVFGAAWVADNMPLKELERQRRAFRAGAMRAGVVAGAMLAVVAALGGVAWGQAKRAETSAALANDALRKLRVKESEATRRAFDNYVLSEKARGAADKAHEAEGKATRSARTARMAEKNARDKEAATQRALASVQAANARASAANRRRFAALLTASKAQDERNVAQQSEQDLLYATSMQQASDAYNGGNEVQVGRTLAEVRQRNERPGWEYRHFLALYGYGQDYGGHQGRVGRVAYAPNGDLLTLDGTVERDRSADRNKKYPRLAYDGRGTVRRWSSEGRLLGAFSLRDAPGAVALDLSPRGDLIAVATSRGGVQIRSVVPPFAVERTLPGKGGALAAISLGASPQVALVWEGLERETLDLVTGERLSTVGRADISTYGDAFDLFPNGDLLAREDARQDAPDGTGALTRFARTGDGLYRRLWHLASRGGAASVAAISPSGRRAAYVDAEGAAHIVDATKGVVLGEPIVRGVPLTALAFSPDERRLAVGSDEGTVWIADVEGRAPLVTLQARHPGITSLAFAPDGGALAVGASDAAQSFPLGFDAPAGALDPPAGRASVRPSIAVSPDNRWIAAPDDAVRLLDAKTGAEVRAFGEGQYHASFSRDGRLLATSGDPEIDGSRRVHLWDPATGQPKLPIVLPESRSAAQVRVRLSPDGRLAAIYGDDAPSCMVYDVASRRPVGRPVRGEGRLAQAVFSPDGRWMALVGERGSLSLYDARTGLPGPLLVGARADDHARIAAFSPDGRTLVVGWDSGYVQAFDAQTGASRKLWAAHVRGVTGLDFPDSGTLVTASADRTLRMWNAATWRLVGTRYYAEGVRSLQAGGSGAVYAVVGTRLNALRASPGSDVPFLPPPATAKGRSEDFRSALRESERTRRPLLAVVGQTSTQNMATLRAMFDDAEVGPILRRHFVPTVIDLEHAAVEPRRSALDDFLGRVREDTSDLHAVAVFAPGAKSPDFDSRRDGDPFDPKGVPAFARALAKAAPGMTAAEGVQVTTFVAAQAAVFARDQEAGAAYLRSTEQIRATQDIGQAQELVRKQALVLPTYLTNVREQAAVLARAGRYREAGDALMRAIDEYGKPVSDDLVWPLALYALAEDTDRFENALEKMERTSPNEYDGYRAPFARAFSPRLIPDPKSYLGWYDHYYRDRLSDPRNFGHWATYVLLLMRAGEYQEAERRLILLRQLAPFTGAEYTPDLRRILQTSFALLRVGQGDVAAARRELAVADSFGPATEAERAAKSGYEAVAAVLRREALRRVEEMEAPKGHVAPPAVPTAFLSLGALGYVLRRWAL